MVQHDDAGDDAEDADDERPEPRLRAIDEYPHQLQHADEKQVKAQEHRQRHQGRRRVREQQGAEDERRNSLE